MRYIFILSVLLTVLSCKKNKPDAECAIPAIVPFQPYSDPVWHPNGQLLGFNHTPLASIGQNGIAPCIWYSYFSKPDSTGFYLMNKDGSGFRRATNFRLSAPAWSPDGNWIAFSLGAQIFKMQYNGTTFDTAHLIQLTNNGGNFYPSWTANSDSIYYDSNAGTNGQGYYVWKMSSDGTGKVGIPNTGRQPHVGSDSKIYYIGLKEEIFSMNKDGSNQQQYSNNGFGVGRPKYWQGKVFYNYNNIGVISVSGTKGVKIISPAITYDISINGEIVYGKFDYGVLNREMGTLWVMNADGSSNRQLTFNNY